MPRKFQIQGTKTFYYWALALLALGLWSVKDGWFPAQGKIDTKTVAELENFQVFNKSLAVLSLVSSAICAYIHKVVK